MHGNNAGRDVEVLIDALFSRAQEAHPTAASPIAAFENKCQRRT
jgi:hypothetical protein